MRLQLIWPCFLACTVWKQNGDWHANGLSQFASLPWTGGGLTSGLHRKRSWNRSTGMFVWSRIGVRVSKNKLRTALVPKIGLNAYVHRFYQRPSDFENEFY